MSGFFYAISTSLKTLHFLLKLFPALVSGAVFFWGADNIDFFDYTINESGLGGFVLSTYVSRVAVGMVFGSALVLLFNQPSRLWLWLYRIPLFILLYVALYQAIWIPLERCYFCFWELFEFSPWQGPLVWMTLLAWSWLPTYQTSIFKLRLPKVVPALLLLISISTPFILNYPAHWMIYGEYVSRPVNKTLQLDSLQHFELQYQNMKPDASLSKGELLVCFSSLTCPYCTRAAYKLHLIKKAHPELRCLLVLTGDAKLIQAFQRKTQSTNVPTVMLNNNWFHRATGGSVPQIFRVKNDLAYEKISYWALDAEHLGTNP